MKLNIHRHLPIALLIGAFSVSANADSPSRINAGRINAAKINSANELVRTGEFAKAIEDYREIPVTEQTHDELNYNSGVALYRQGDVDAARALFSETSTSADNPLAAAARYNLGNCFYTDAVATAEQDKQASIDSLNQAITQYRASLRANPNHVDARANIELAVELRKKLEDELKQQEQERDADQQGSKSEESESPQDQASEQSPPEDGGSDGSEKQDDQQAPADENDAAEEQPEKQPEEQESDKNETSENESQSAEDKPAEGQPESASQDANSQPQSAQEPSSSGEPASDEQSELKDDVVPSGELKPANEPQENEGRQGNVAIPSADEELMTREEAMKMLQSVRDRDMLRRLRQDQLERSRHVPTDRDW